MRKIDKKNNIKKVNLLFEKRYLINKGLIKENDIEEDWKTKTASALMGLGSLSASGQAPAPSQNNNNSIQMDNSKTNSDTKVSDPFGVNKKDEVLNFKLLNTFKSGDFELDSTNGDVSKMIETIKAFSQKNPDAIIKINIVGSESQVPNQNNLGRGALSKARANKIGEILNSNINAILRIDVKTVIGNEKWDNGQNKDDSKFTKDQFVSLTVEALQTSCSITKMKKTKGTTNTLSSSVTGTISNSLKPGNIPDRMVLTNSSNQIIGDTGFFADGSHGLNGVKLIPKYVLQLTKLYEANDKSIQGIDKQTIIKLNSYEELLKYFFEDGTDIKKYMKYENDIGNPLNEFKERFSKGNNVIIIYNIIPNNVKTIEHELGSETGRINVYSPLQQTDFSITSKQCN